MSTGDLRTLDALVASLAAARKCVQFYPKNNPNVDSSLERLAARLSTLYATSSADSKVPDSTASFLKTSSIPAGLILEVDRDVFMYGKDEVGVDSAPARKLAGDFYRLGIKQIHFLPDIDCGELHRFFELTCLTSEDIESLGGFPAALRVKGIEDVCVALLPNLDLVDQDDLPDDFDLVSYLRHKQALRLRPNEQGEEDDFPDDESADASELADFFLDIAKGSEEKRRYLFNTLCNPSKLAQALTLIRQASGVTDLSECSDVSLRHLQDDFRAIAAAIETFPDETRDAFVRNMAEAILTTDARTTDHVLAGALAESVGEGGVPDAILLSLPNEEIVDVLCKSVTLHAGTANTIKNFMDEFGDDSQRRADICDLFEARSNESPSVPLKQVLELLQTDVEIVTVTDPDAHTRNNKFVDHTARDILAQKLHLHDDELEAIEREAEIDFNHATAEHAARTLFELFACLKFETLSVALSDNLTTALLVVVEEGHYDSLSEILTFATEEMPSDTQARIRSSIQEVIRECSYPKHVDRIVNTLRKREKRSTEFRNLLNLLGLLGDIAADHLFMRLELEKNRSARLFLVSLFVDLGERMLPALERKAKHRDWFVVRNVVYILGKIGSSTALNVLEPLLDHSDSRVPREVVRALAGIKDDRAEWLLMECLDSNDPWICRLAAEWLGQRGSQQALDRFTALLASRKEMARKDVNVIIGAVRAVGRMGGSEHISLIKSMSPRTRLFNNQGKRELAEACTESIMRLRGESVQEVWNAAYGARRKHGRN
ncbi:MAG: HEAT repeat domain-containing protein [Candidatus Hydrogenedentes bacterium]|nr:HEAT repeat domain-containing protein [Candidatus Hydrogenedentota bacterium]